MYHNISSRGVKVENAILELNKILDYYATDVKMTEEYKEDFKEFLKTYDSEVMQIYYPLAKCMHLYSCPLNHEEYDNIISCDELEKYKYKATFESYEEYVARECLISYKDEVRIPFIRLYKSWIEMSILLEELNSVYYFGQAPIDMGDEWEFYFSNLESTLKEEESLFETYYDLAVYIHKLDCTYNHTINSYDACICDNMHLTKTLEE